MNLYYSDFTNPFMNMFGIVVKKNKASYDL